MINTRSFLFAGLLAAAPVASFGFTRVGLGLNFGFPIYDSPRPTSVVVVQQPAATEVVPASPGPAYVWIAGHWEWDTPGARWVWHSGSWRMPPAPNAVWQAGYWSQQGNAWVWVHSHWAVPSSPQGAPPPPAAVPNPPAAPQSAPAASAPAAAAPAEVVVNEAPPASIVEEVYAAPGPDFVWIGGCWSWRGAWVWLPGHYERPPHRGAVWMPGSWRHTGHGWAWVGGRWR